jgi:hypothetical protein
VQLKNTVGQREPQFIGHELAEDGSELRSFFAAIFDAPPIAPLPWGNAEFDCILVCADPAKATLLAESFATAIVRCAVDWVQVTGPGSERIHDLVDEASVRAGVQAAVGDGHPMTSWHEEAVSPSAHAEVARHCHGASDYVLCLVAGSESHYSEFIEALSRSLVANG